MGKDVEVDVTKWTFHKIGIKYHNRMKCISRTKCHKLGGENGHSSALGKFQSGTKSKNQ
jgi:hypothetical protein